MKRGTRVEVSPGGSGPGRRGTVKWAEAGAIHVKIDGERGRWVYQRKNVRALSGIELLAEQAE